MELNVKELVSQMKEMEEKSNKYDELKVNIEEVMQKLNEKFGEIQELLSDISPMISVKKKYNTTGYNKSYGKKVIGYIQNAYKYLIDTGEYLPLPKLLTKLNLTDIKGGTEHQVRTGLKTLKGIKTTKDSNDSRIILFYYDKSEGKLELNRIPATLSEKVRKKEDIRVDVVDENKELMKSVPEKFSHMG